jgi:hypothetical protein
MSPRRAVFQNPILESQFHGELDEAGSGRTHDFSKVGIIDFPIHRGWPVELGMIERVKCFQAEFERFRVTYSQQFVERHVEIADPGPVEKSAARIPQLSQRFRDECGGIELGPTVPRIGIDVERSAIVVRGVEQVVVYTISQRAQQRTVGVVVEGYGKASAETSGAGQAPSVDEAVLVPEKLIKRQADLIARDKVVFHIKGGNRAGGPKVQRIELLDEVRALINRLAVGVSDQKA